MVSRVLWRRGKVFRKVFRLIFLSNAPSPTTPPLYLIAILPPARSLPFVQIYEAIRHGADAFLSAEYTICCIFIVVFGTVVFFLVSISQTWVQGAFTTGSFVLGAVTSILAGYIGMKVCAMTRTRPVVIGMFVQYRTYSDSARVL